MVADGQPFCWIFRKRLIKLHTKAWPGSYNIMKYGKDLDWKVYKHYVSVL